MCSSVVKALRRGGDAAAKGDEFRRIVLSRHRYNCRFAEQTAEMGFVPCFFAGDWNEPGGSGFFLFITPIVISSAIIAARVSAEISPARATISSPTEHTLVIASSFSIERSPRLADSAIFEIFAHRDECAAKTSDVGACEGASLFHRVVYERKGGGCAGDADAAQPET